MLPIKNTWLHSTKKQTNKKTQQNSKVSTHQFVEIIMHAFDSITSRKFVLLLSVSSWERSRSHVTIAQFKIWGSKKRKIAAGFPEEYNEMSWIFLYKTINKTRQKSNEKIIEV